MSTASAPISGSLASILIAELENEAKVTREMLSRIPAEKFDFKPHERSMAFGRLAVHIAEMFSWVTSTIQFPELDFSKIEYTPYEPATTQDLVEYFDKNVIAAVKILEQTPNEVFADTWSLRNGETIYFTLPKAAVMRSFVMNHIIHHRGQLSVYLRLNEIAVPPIYGPSADEGTM